MCVFGKGFPFLVVHVLAETAHFAEHLTEFLAEHMELMIAVAVMMYVLLFLLITEFSVFVILSLPYKTNPSLSNIARS